MTLHLVGKELLTNFRCYVKSTGLGFRIRFADLLIEPDWLGR